MVVDGAAIAAVQGNGKATSISQVGSSTALIVATASTILVPANLATSVAQPIQPQPRPTTDDTLTYATSGVAQRAPS